MRYGCEFRDTSILEPLFRHHPLWPRFCSIISEGVRFPLKPLPHPVRKQDLQDALDYGNHKGARENPALLEELVNKDVTLGHSLVIPLEKVLKIDGALMAPMNIIDQHTITELGKIISTLRLTHNQFKVFSSTTSVNS